MAKRLIKATLLAAAIASVASVTASEYKMHVPSTGLKVTTAPATPAPAPVAPKDYTFNPANNESFTIPAGATKQSYDIYVRAVYGEVEFKFYRGDTEVYSVGCGCGAAFNTFTATNLLLPGHTYRLVITKGTLLTSTLKYTN